MAMKNFKNKKKTFIKSNTSINKHLTLSERKFAVVWTNVRKVLE